MRRASDSNSYIKLQTIYRGFEQISFSQSQCEQESQSNQLAGDETHSECTYLGFHLKRGSRALETFCLFPPNINQIFNCMFVFITWSSALRLGVRIVLEICTRGVGPKVYLGTAEALECCLAVSDGLWHAVDSLRFENVIFKNHHSLLPVFGRSETKNCCNNQKRKKTLLNTVLTVSMKKFCKKQSDKQSG